MDQVLLHRGAQRGIDKEGRQRLALVVGHKSHKQSDSSGLITGRDWTASRQYHFDFHSDSTLKWGNSFAHYVGTGEESELREETVHPDGTGTVYLTSTYQSGSVFDDEGHSDDKSWQYDWHGHSNLKSDYTARAERRPDGTTWLTEYKANRTDEHDLNLWSSSDGQVSHFHRWGNYTWTEGLVADRIVGEFHDQSHWNQFGSAYVDDSWDYPIDRVGFLPSTLEPGSTSAIAGTIAETAVGELNHVLAHLRGLAEVVTANPGVFLGTVIIATYERTIDFGVGVIDGFLDTINPFDALWSVPDLGPVYGHTGFYGAGYATGLVGGIVVQSMIGNAAAFSKVSRTAMQRSM